MVKFIIISLEGNIGAGKSTLFQMIKKEFPEAFFLEEPLESWQFINNDPNLNMLEKFYQDPQRWGYTFQIFAYQSRLMYWDKKFKEFESLLQGEKNLSNTLQNTNLETPQKSNQEESPMKSNESLQTQESDSKKSIDNNEQIQLVFTERSIESSRTLFFRNCYKLKHINELEYHIFEEFYAWLMKSYEKYLVDQIIYIFTPAQECFNRLKRRGRSEESSVPLDYLKDLEDRHIEWFKEEEGKVNIVEIDATENYLTDKDVQQRIMSFVRKNVEDLKQKIQQTI